MSKTKTFLRYNAWLIFLDILAFSMSYLLTLYIRFMVNKIPTIENRLEFA